MTEDTLAQAVELKDIIEDTRKGLERFRELQKGIRKKKEESFYDDGLYNLSIFEHSDGSGDGYSFSRYQGNEQLLIVIIKTVEDQLSKFEQELAGL